MIIDYKYLIFTKYLFENIFNVFQTAQTMKFLLDINAFTNKFQKLYYIKLNL